MDAQRGCKSIHEGCCTSIGEELGKRPFHSYKSLNSVSWLDLKSAVGSDEELKNVLNSDIPVLSAEALLNLAVHAEHSKAFIPLVHIDNLAILDDRSGHSAWICNPDSDSHRPTWSTKSEYHFLRWSACEGQVIYWSSRSFNDDWEPTHPEQISIHSIPRMFHHSVDLIIHFSSLFGHIHWMEPSIRYICVLWFEKHHSQLVSFANVSIHSSVWLTSLNIRGKSWVVGNQLKVPVGPSWLWAEEFRVFKIKKCVQRRGTREITA